MAQGGNANTAANGQATSGATGAQAAAGQAGAATPLVSPFMFMPQAPAGVDPAQFAQNQ